jgi:hypothetical protein
MTIAQQVAHDFLESIEKMITANKLDVGVLDTKISYQSCEEAMMNVADTKTGSIIATMRLNLNTNKLKREMQEKELENYCRKRICPICVFKEQEPCTVNKIDYGTATSEEVEESYRKMVENKNDKRRYNH